MTPAEFSAQFDILLNSYGGQGDSPNQKIICDEYEKSLFLTLAQDEIVKQLYSGDTNKGFEQTEELRRSLDSVLATSKTLNSREFPSTITDKRFTSVSYELPNDLWFIVHETIIGKSDNECKNNTNLQVVPTTLNSYYHATSSPFRQPNERRALRIDIGQNKVQIIYNNIFTSVDYQVKYIKSPTPIILVDLSNTNLTIKNRKDISPCSLNSQLHPSILSMAVTLARASKTDGTKQAKTN